MQQLPQTERGIIGRSKLTGQPIPKGRPSFATQSLPNRTCVISPRYARSVPTVGESFDDRLIAAGAADQNREAGADRVGEFRFLFLGGGSGGWGRVSRSRGPAKKIKR